MWSNVKFDRYPANYVEPLLYEVEMLNETYKLLEGKNKGHLTSAILESFLLHARVLIYFLEDSGKYEDDLKCSFFKDEYGKPIEAEVVKLQTDTRATLNKFLAHLTLGRADTRVQWNVTQIRDVLNEHIREFIKKCRDSDFPDDSRYSKEAFYNLTKPSS